MPRVNQPGRSRQNRIEVYLSDAELEAFDAARPGSRTEFARMCIAAYLGGAGRGGAGAAFASEPPMPWRQPGAAPAAAPEPEPTVDELVELTRQAVIPNPTSEES